MQDMHRVLANHDLSEVTVMSMDLKEAQESMIPFRVAGGFLPRPVKLLTHPNENIKLDHSRADKVAAFGLSLAPAGMSGWQVCRWRTKGCESACLATSGNGRYTRTQEGRIWKTKWLAQEPVAFLRVLAAEIDAIPVTKWRKDGWTASLRLNVLSDIDWTKIAPWVIQRAVARGIRLYDYTKDYGRSDRASAIGWDVSLSVHEKTTEAEIRTMRRPVVVVDISRGSPLPATYAGRVVVDGDRSDARFLDAPDAVVLLRYKEVTTTKKASAVESGFVRHVAW